MLRTVKEVSELSGVTIKTLHHYHKIGLLAPREITDAGYRLYGMEELEKLQQILFYRELDFPLEQIKRLLAAEPDRLAILSEQRKLLLARKDRLEQLIRTMNDTMDKAKKGEGMEMDKMFAGFGSESEWKEALSAQNEHLKETYGFDLMEGDAPIDVPEMNAQAAEAAAFMAAMADALRAGKKHSDEEVMSLVERHVAFQREHGDETNAETFAMQCRFFLEDDFHRGMLESQQTGLAYYLSAAADAYSK